VGYESLVADHTSMGTGALFSEGIFPLAFQRVIQSRDPNLNGPELVFVRLRSGVSPAAGRADMQRIATEADKVFAADPHAEGNNVVVLGVQHPAQIVNYRSIGSTPVILAVGLALGALVALGLTLAASVRRRRRDLALLKALGFTQRQLAAAVAWQATVTAVIGAIVGIPLGVVSGRQLWILFAHKSQRGA
jgi:putative ABC transport system permease protein